MRIQSHCPSKYTYTLSCIIQPILIIHRERNEDGKSLKNPQHGVLSKAYDEFPDPLSKGLEGGFDIHIYHFQVSHATSRET